jgi:mRNA interferase RelE/StbE
MTYQLVLRPAAVRDLRKLPRTLRERIERVIEALREEPRPSGCKKLTGFENEWRVRVGDYRVLYVIDDTRREVRIARIVHRREAYR